MSKNVYILAGLAALMMAACTNDELLDGTQETTQQPTQQPTPSTEAVSEQGDIIAISRELLQDEGELDLDSGEDNPAAGTRAIYDPTSGLQAWEVGDQISVSDGTRYASYEVDKVYNDGSCHFVNNGTPLLNTNDQVSHYYAIYPEISVTGSYGRGGWTFEGIDENQQHTNVTVRSMVFAEQDYTENMRLSGSNSFGNYMVADADVSGSGENKQLNLAFKTLTSVIDIDISALNLSANEIPVSVGIKSNSGASLVGYSLYNFDTHSIRVSTADRTGYSANSQCDVIRVGNVSPDASIVRFYALPVTLEGGITISVETYNSNTRQGYSYTKKSSATIGQKPASNGISLTGVQNLTGGAAPAVCQPYYKKINFGGYSTGKKGDWMAVVPSDIYFSLLSIPGAHDAATKDCGINSSICQSLTLQELLDNGCRALDLRPAPDFTYNLNLAGTQNSTHDLEIYHGISRTNVKFTDALSTVSTFLADHPTETVFIILHREDAVTGIADRFASDIQINTEKWGQEVYQAIKTHYDNGKVLQTLASGTTLAQCRGKMVFITRDETYDGSTIRYFGCKVNWGDNIMRTRTLLDNNGNVFPGAGFYLTYQDIYNTDSQGETNACDGGYTKLNQTGGATNAANKITLIKAMIDESSKTTGDSEMENQRFFINYISWAGQNPNTAANNIMPSINPYIKEQTGRMGILMADYVGNETYGGRTFISNTIQANFKYVFRGRSRIHQEADDTVLGDKTGLVIRSGENADDTEVYAPAFRH